MQFTHNSSFTDKPECSQNFIYLCLRGVRPRRNAASMKVINKVSERALITSWTWHSPFHSENCKYQENLCPFQALFLIRRSKQNEEMLSFSVDLVVSAAMNNFFSPCSANRPEVFSGCDKRIWIEKSSLYSTKALLISAYRFSFTFDEITAFISNSDALRFWTFFKLVSSGKPPQCRRRALSQSGSSNHALLITKKCPRD